MRGWQLLLGSVLLAGCSGQRPPAEDTTAPATQQASSTRPAAAATAATSAVATPTTNAEAAARSSGFVEAVSTLHRYIGALPGADRAAADALWTGGRPAPVPDDAVLRSLQDIQSLRIDTDPPVALDTNTPPQRIEVPLRVTVRTRAGIESFSGAYRLQTRAASGDANWEIYSASLHPQLR